jgi:type IV secretion system protein VirB4
VNTEISSTRLDREYFVDDNVSGLIPIACHFDSKTLLTKNGELVQIICVDDCQRMSAEQTPALRESVRKTLLENFADVGLQVNIYVIRDRKEMSPNGQLPFGIANELNEYWNKKHNWHQQLNNTLYISLVYESVFDKVLDPTSFVLNQFIKTKRDGLEDKLARLNAIAEKIEQDLSPHGARVLDMVKMEDGSYNSEPLSFYYYLTHLQKEQTPPPMRDISELLSNVGINYGFNHMEITSGDHKNYAAIYTIKETLNMPSEAYDVMLHIGSKFILTETLFISPRQQVLDKFNKIKLNTDPSSTAIELCGIKDILAADSGNVNDYVAQQISILIHSDEESFFVKKNESFLKEAHRCGMVAIREDFNMPRIFWSQLPGNARFVSRVRDNALSRAAVFASIHQSYLAGMAGSKWGEPISLFRNADGNPFYFNFHPNNSENGNTLVIGPKNAGKSTMIRFLIAQASKCDPHVISLDVEGSNHNFIREVGGISTTIEPEDESPIAISPLELDMFKNNKELLGRWLEITIVGDPKSEMLRGKLNPLVEQLLALEDSSFFLETVGEFIESLKDEGIKNLFHQNLGLPALASFTAYDNLELLQADDYLNIDLSKLSDGQKFAIIPMILSKLEEGLDGRPTIIVLNHFDLLFQDGIFGDFIALWLDKISQKNAIALFSISYDSHLLNNETFRNCLPLFNSKFFMSDRLADKYFRRVFDLSEWDLYKIKSYEIAKRMFLIKQGDLRIVTSFDLSDAPEIIEVMK